MQSLLKLVLALTLAAVANSQTNVQSFALAKTSATNCDVIVAGSTFEGDCCAMNVTQGNGCVLYVEGGNCKVRSTPYGLSLHLILVELTPFFLLIIIGQGTMVDGGPYVNGRRMPSR